MEYYDQNYLDLFKQINQEPTQHIEKNDYSYEQLRDNSYDAFSLLKGNNTSAYTQVNQKPAYNEQWGNLNEVQRNTYSQDYNVNEFNIETRINGQSINEVRQQQKEDKLNEVMEHLRQERLNEVMRVEKERELQNLNEKVLFDEANIITLEMFEKARVNSMLMLNNKMKEKGWM
jgi:hypothetical protein